MSSQPMSVEPEPNSSSWMDLAYVDVTVRRWQDFTGREAVLEHIGCTFAKTRNERVNCTPEQLEPGG